MKNFSAAIFDLDGTLIDSMYIWERIDKEFLYNFDIIPDKDYNKVISELSFFEGIEYIKNRYNLSLSKEQIIKELNNIAYRYYSEEITLKDGVYDFLDDLYYKNIKIGIATSCMKNMCVTVLKKHNILKYIDTIVYSDDIKKNKSFPDIYIETAKQLNTSINNCIIFEDMPFAIMGAKKSGAFVVGVYDKYSSDKVEEIKLICDKFIYKFCEFYI